MAIDDLYEPLSQRRVRGRREANRRMRLPLGIAVLVWTLASWGGQD
jgi:hypothetical protein